MSAKNISIPESGIAYLCTNRNTSINKAEIDKEYHCPSGFVLFTRENMIDIMSLPKDKNYDYAGVDNVMEERKWKLLEVSYSGYIPDSAKVWENFVESFKACKIKLLRKVTLYELKEELCKDEIS